MTDIEFKILLNQRLCDLAEAILCHYDPCQIKKDSCLVAENIPDNPLHCCGKCPWRPHGECNFRYIRCKTWLCTTAIAKNPECVEILREIETIARRFDLTRGPFLGQRYAGMNAELAAMREREEQMKPE